MNSFTTITNNLYSPFSPFVPAKMFIARTEVEWIQCNQCLDDHLNELFTYYNNSKEREMLI